VRVSWTLLVCALLGTGARADTLDLAESGYVPDTLGQGRMVYGYVPRLQHDRSWAGRQLRAMRERASERRTRAKIKSYRDETMEAHRRRERELSSDLEGTALETTMLSTAAGEGGTEVVPRSGGAAGTSGMAIEFMATDVELARMAGVPESALTMATAVIDLTDKATNLALSLQGVLARQLDIDWRKFFRDRDFGSPDADEDEKQRGRGGGGGGGAADEESARYVAVARRRRAVRSALNIILGILIGVVLWMIARRL